MKKRLLVIIMILVLAAIPLAGCESTFSRSRLAKAQDTSYIVQGNGGNAVQYGNFIYFINGYSGYDDEEGTANRWGEVIKGALYRVELTGEKQGDKFVTSSDEISGLEFASKPFVIDQNEYEYFLSDAQFDTLRNGVLMIETDLNVDYVDNEDYEPDIVEEFFYMEDVQYRIEGVELVASKVIGTSGYTDGGIFIFDGWIYYASPNNQRSKSGEIQTTKTDFYRTSLNGTKTHKLYTTESTSNSAPYKFYKQGNFTYLVALDGTNLISVKMNDRKIVAKKILADDATQAYFPDKAVYNAADNKTDGVEDFVYYTRDVNADDAPIKTGNVIEVARPSGECRFELVKSGRTSKIESVKDGLVFYRNTTDSNRETLLYTNMHDALLLYNNGVSAYSEFVSGVALDLISSDYTSLICFRPNGSINTSDNTIYVLGFTSNAVFVEDNINLRIKIANEQALNPIVYENNLYYIDSSNVYKSINLFTPHGENTAMQIDTQAAVSANIRNSVVAGYFVYMGTYDDYASAYAKFFPINDGDTAKPIFIGERQESDTKQPPAEA